MDQLRKRGNKWWIRYYRNGRRYEETSGSTKRGDAERLLRLREGDVARGLPVTAKVGQLRFDEAADDLENDYVINGRRSRADLAGRIRLHLKPFFGGRRMAAITTTDVRLFVRQRLEAEASNGEINRALTALKRMYSLAIQAGKLLMKPYIPMLQEPSPRNGFFSAEQIEAVARHLPNDIAPLVRFAFITGWRVPSEVQKLLWRQVDFAAGEVRLDAGQTKNKQGRTFPLTTELRQLLDDQRRRTDELQRRTGAIVPYVFHRHGRPIKSFYRVWRTACAAAGCPGRIPHDLRRSAVRTFVRAGVPERVAMQLSGHLTRSVFERYNVVSEGDLRTAVTLLDDAHQKTSASRAATQ